MEILRTGIDLKEIFKDNAECSNHGGNCCQNGECCNRASLSPVAG